MAVLFFLLLAAIGIWEMWQTIETGEANLWPYTRQLHTITRDSRPIGFYLIVALEMLLVAFMLLLGLRSAGLVWMKKKAYSE